jgi:hypothetical protein
MSNIDGQMIRRVLLEVIEEYSRNRQGLFQSGTILHNAAAKLNIRGNIELERALLTLWSDLFRSGYIAWGHDLDSAKPPFYHITEQGRRTLEHLSRDPANPDGYLKHISDWLKDHAIADSYLREALDTYNSACFKAAAVMVGAVTESLVLDLRETLVARINLWVARPQKNCKIGE